MTPEKWTEYTKEYQPFLLPFDAVAASIHEDGDLDRIQSVVTVHEALAEPAAPAPAGPNPEPSTKEESTWQSESG